MATLKELYPDAPPEILPSEYQQKVWGHLVDFNIPPNDKWAFSGWCPIHDTDRKEVSALFYFKSGIMTCTKVPSCHEGKKYLSLTNVALAMLDRDTRRAE
jgi:hypothetical protein